METREVVITTIEMGFVNAFLLRGERTVLIDTGYPGSEDRIFKSMTDAKISPDDVSLILITHGHIDHVGSLEAILDKIKAPVAIHGSEVQSITDGIPPDVVPAKFIGRIFKFLLSFAANRNPRGITPEILITDELDLKPYGVNARVLHTPGHTYGSVSIITESGEAIIGDMIMGGLVRKRSPGVPFFAEDIGLLRESVKRILDYDPGIIYASHGGPFEPDAVRDKLM